MRIRLYSIPFWGGVPNDGFSLWISYVSAGGGDVKSRTAEYDSTTGAKLPSNVMGGPRSDEIFTVQGINRSTLQSGDSIQLITSDGNFVGIEHDEEDRTDSVIATDTEPGPSNTFLITFVNDVEVNQKVASIAGLDPFGPPQPVAFLGRNQNYLSFSQEDDGPLEIGLDVVGEISTFLLGYLPDPLAPHHRRPHRRQR